MNTRIFSEMTKPARSARFFSFTVGVRRTFRPRTWTRTGSGSGTPSAGGRSSWTSGGTTWCGGCGRSTSWRTRYVRTHARFGKCIVPWSCCCFHRLNFGCAIVLCCVAWCVVLCCIVSVRVDSVRFGQAWLSRCLAGRKRWCFVFLCRLCFLCVVDGPRHPLVAAVFPLLPRLFPPDDAASLGSRPPPPLLASLGGAKPQHQPAGDHHQPLLKDPLLKDHKRSYVRMQWIWCCRETIIRRGRCGMKA